MRSIALLALLLSAWTSMSPSVCFAASKANKSSGSGTPGGAYAQRPFGVGIILGEPSGLSAKYWFNHPAAVDFGLAFSFDNYFLFYSDYLWHFPNAFGHSSVFARALTPYIGVGGMLIISTQDSGNKSRTYFESSQGSAGFAVRIPLGMEWRPNTVPLGVFAEIVPGLGVIPATYGLVQGGIGIRFYF